MTPEISGGNQFINERGNVLGISTPNVNPWVQQILQHGQLKSDSPVEKPLSAIVKLYDKHVDSYKLNEQISFIGVLEF